MVKTHKQDLHDVIDNLKDTIQKVTFSEANTPRHQHVRIMLQDQQEIQTDINVDDLYAYLNHLDNLNINYECVRDFDFF